MGGAHAAPMSKKPRKRLSFNVETVKPLDEGRLDDVNGGAAGPSNGNCGTQAGAPSNGNCGTHAGYPVEGDRGTGRTEPQTWACTGPRFGQGGTGRTEPPSWAC